MKSVFGVRQLGTDDDARDRSRWGWRRIVERVLADIAMALMGVFVAALFCLTR